MAMSRLRTSNREAAVKASLTANLIESIKEVQIKHTNSGGTLTSEEETNSLCNVLEAIFIHGLKDTFMKRVSSVLGGDVDRMPEPDFWSPLMVISHKDVISQISCYTRIATDIGRCRAWLRLALNEGLLCSYLTTMQKDKSTLKDYYSRMAYLRDSEQFDIMQNYLVGVEAYEFQLACNSSVLNSWTSSPLVLAGLWAPPMNPQIAVVQGIDAVEVFGEEAPSSPYPICSRPQSLPYIARTPILNEDEALRVILASRREDDEDDSVKAPEVKVAELKKGKNKANKNARGGRKVRRHKHIADESEQNLSEPPEPTAFEPTNLQPSVFETTKLEPSAFETAIPDPSAFENTRPEEQLDATQPPLETPKEEPSESQATSNGYNDMVEVEVNQNNDEDSNEERIGNSLGGRLGWSSSFEEERDEEGEMSISRLSSESESFQSLLQNYNPVSGPIARTTPDMADLHRPADSGPGTPKIGEEELQKDHYLAQLQKIATEPGLDSQNYECKECGRPIGMIYGKPRVCSYSGHYYCYECHENDEMEIPAKILHNWDFQKYPVCKSAKQFLMDIENEPLMNVMEVNPLLYHVIEEMAELQNLRTQLNFLRAYLYTCREPVIEELRHRVWPREYLCEHVHLYSFHDLLNAPTRMLAHKLQKVVAFARTHVTECCTCKPKGFICEVCNNPQIIYPFDLGTTYRCPSCCAVFHSECLDANKPCPKCNRRKKREESFLDLL